VSRQRLFLLFLSGLVLAWLWMRRAPGGSPLLGKAAPDFTLRVAMGEGRETGDRIRLSDLRNEVVLLDFWASWCNPCRTSTPTLSRVSEHYAGRGVRVLGINSEAIGPGRFAFLETSWGFRYPTLSDGALEAAAAYKVRVYPTLVVIDRGGIVRFVHQGPESESLLRSEIDSLIK
jgi:thiol-disulfide isomerase/thioredoxin